MPLAIINAKVYSQGALSQRNILLENGRIAKITSDKISCKKNIDARGMWVLPGFIDSHVHFREPGLTQKGNFLTESSAAVKGGITTVLDMPNTRPPTTNALELEKKRELAKKSVANYGFHFGAELGNISEIKKAKNIASVKLYADHTTGNLRILSEDYIAELLRASRITAVHAEGETVKKIIEIAAKNNVHNALYFCHVSSKEEFSFAKSNPNLQTYVELTPHHLFLTKEYEQKKGAFAVMKPPLRTKEDRQFLEYMLRSKKIDTIATDHAPHTITEKQQIPPPFGVPGVETMLPLLIDAHLKNKLPLRIIIECCCENPAKIFKIKNKGFIAMGYDADLVIVDPNCTTEVKNSEQLTKCGWSAFEGWKLQGWPVITIVNGNIVYEQGIVHEIPAREVTYER